MIIYGRGHVITSAKHYYLLTASNLVFNLSKYSVLLCVLAAVVSKHECMTTVRFIQILDDLT